MTQQGVTLLEASAQAALLAVKRARKHPIGVLI